MSDTPPDWVLIEGAKRFNGDGDISDAFDIEWARKDYAWRKGYRALCDMIAKYEQPPVGPDVEAVKRIVSTYFHCDTFHVGNDERFARAVAQYKLERSK